MKEINITKNDLATKLLYVTIVVLFILIILSLVLFGVRWDKKDLILVLLISNITINVGILGYLINLDNKIASHLGWHKGRGDFR